MSDCYVLNVVIDGSPFVIDHIISRFPSDLYPVLAFSGNIDLFS